MTVTNSPQTIKDRPQTSTKRILVVDDEEAVTGLIATLLSKRGYAVTVAHCGADAIRLAAEQIPNLILMDITMPDGDGYETTQKIKQHPALKSVPVIFLTGRSPQEDGGRSFTAGGLTYVKKPFGAKQLQDLVDLALQSV